MIRVLETKSGRESWGSFMYVGPQGIVRGTAATLLGAAAKDFLRI
ncbi:MAG: hypothetical protein ABI333_12305 [bacterium]